MSDAADVKADDDDAAKPKGGGLKVIIMLVVGIVIGGGGAAGYFLFLAPKPTAPDDAHAAAEVEVPEPADQTPIHIKLDRVSAPLVAKSGRIIGYVLLNVQLEFFNPDDEKYLRDRVPQIKHAVNRAVAQRGVGYPDQPRKIDFDTAATRMREGINAVMGDHPIHAVQIISVTPL